jgi:hypothetical protein
MLTWNKRERLDDDFMGVALERGVAYQFDLAGAAWTGTWTGEWDFDGTPIFAQIEDRCRRAPRGATWFGRLSRAAVVDCFAIGDGMVSDGNPYRNSGGQRRGVRQLNLTSA